MNEDYISYQTAVKLKAAGFNELCRYYYNPKGVLRHAKDNALSPEALNNRYLDEIADGICSAVPLWQAQKWLREVKGVDIEIRVWLVGNEREYRPHVLPPQGKDFIAYPPEKRYESALSAGIAAALELIEKKGESK